MKTFKLKLIFACLAVMGLLPAALKADPSPSIRHDPVRVAEQGQSVTLIAKVTADPGPITKVTLHYTLSRHSAPLKLHMYSTGMDVYTATIPADYFDRASVIYYYIEAEADGGFWSETTWQAVPVKRSEAHDADAPLLKEDAPGGYASVKGSLADQPREGVSKGTVAAIVGAGVGITIAAVALADSGGGGSSKNTGSSTNTTGGSSSTNNVPQDPAGTYRGSVDIYFQPSGGGALERSADPVTILIDAARNATSPNLADGTPASGTANGEALTMTAPVSQLKPDSSGTLFFNGTVRDGRISGNVSGDAVGGTSPGEYSGNFSLSR